VAHVRAKKWGGHGRPCRPYAAALAILLKVTTKEGNHLLALKA